VLKQIKLEEAHGKVVKEARETTEYNGAAIVFDDGTFLAFMAQKEYYGEVSLNSNPNFDTFDRDNLYAMHALGIISEEEYEKYKNEYDKRWEEYHKKHNRKLLQELKEKEQRGEL
jgi:hypothetical protein